MTNKSFASGNMNYVPLQAYVRDGESLHIQGVGKKVNRIYGVAVDISVDEFDPDLLDYFKSLNHTEKSKASDQLYFKMQAKTVGDSVHFQVPGPEWNRSYGVAFNAEDLYDLVEFINQEQE
jgi:hypothetical protein